MGGCKLVIRAQHCVLLAINYLDGGYLEGFLPVVFCKFGWKETVEYEPVGVTADFPAFTA